MKYVRWIGSLSICLVLGWLIYPALDPLVSGVADHGTTSGGTLVKKVVVEGPNGSVTFLVDLSDLTEKELPSLVTLGRELEVSVYGKPSLILEEGTEVRVRSINDGGVLVVSPVGAAMEGIIPADATDLATRIVEQRFQPVEERRTAGNEAPAPEADVSAPMHVGNTSPAPAPVIAAVMDEPAPADSEPGRPPEQTEYARQAAATFPLPEFPPLMEVVKNWQNVPRNAYPKTVSIKIPLDYEMFFNGEVVGRGQLPKGSAVVPNELKGTTLTISTVSSSPTRTSIDVSQTDFKERVMAQYENSVRTRTAQVHARRVIEEERLAKAAAHEDALGSYNKGDDPRFDAVRESLRQGDAGFYQLDAASKWRWAGQETIDGTEYAVAYVMMTSESAFGVIHRELKALLHDHKVIKWIDVSSGQEL